MRTIKIKIDGYLAYASIEDLRLIGMSQVSEYRRNIRQKVVTQGEFFKRTGKTEGVIGLGAVLTLKKHNPFLKFVVENVSNHKYFPLRVDLLEGMEKRWYQKNAFDAINLHRGGIVEIPTGGGKTVIEIATAVAASNNANVLIAAPTSIIVSQLFDCAKDFNIPVLWYPETRHMQIPKTGNIIIANPVTINNDRRKATNANTRNSISTLISDEGHHMSSVTWYGLLYALPNLCRSYSFSGTAIEHEHNFIKFSQIGVDDALVYASSGPVIYSIKSSDISEYIDCPDIINYEYPWVTPEDKQFNLMERDWKRVVKILEKNFNRRRVIADIARVLDQSGRTTIIPVSKLEIGDLYLKAIRLPSAVCWFGGDKIYSMTRSYTREELYSLLEQRRIRTLIITHHLDEGLNLKMINTVFLTEGRKKRRQRQRGGRSARRDSVKSLVINLYERFQVTMNSQSIDRLQSIKSYFNSKVTHVKTTTELQRKLLEYSRSQDDDEVD